MPTFVVLATTDTSLAESWERQLPSEHNVLRMESNGFLSTLPAGLIAVVVLDAVSERSLPSSLVNSPTVFVGEPHSIPFEQARMAKRAKVYLSYEESAIRLREILPLVEEIAEKQSLVAASCC